MSRFFPQAAECFQFPEEDPPDEEAAAEFSLSLIIC